MIAKIKYEKKIDVLVMELNKLKNSVIRKTKNEKIRNEFINPVRKLLVNLREKEKRKKNAIGKIRIKFNIVIFLEKQKYFFLKYI